MVGVLDPDFSDWNSSASEKSFYHFMVVKVDNSTSRTHLKSQAKILLITMMSDKKLNGASVYTRYDAACFLKLGMQYAECESSYQYL